MIYKNKNKKELKKTEYDTRQKYLNETNAFKL